MMDRFFLAKKTVEPFKCFKAGDTVHCINTVETSLRHNFLYIVDAVFGSGDVQLLGVESIVQNVPVPAFSRDRFEKVVSMVGGAITGRHTVRAGDQRSASEGDQYIGQPYHDIKASEVCADPRRNWFRRRERAADGNRTVIRYVAEDSWGTMPTSGRTRHEFPASSFRQWPGVQDRSAAVMILNELEVNKK